jgi:diamine N-acetyltransferase
MVEIRYVHGDDRMLNEVRGMWEALNLYHCERSAHFKEHYLGMTFQKRKYQLKKKTVGGVMCVDIAVDESTGHSVGYIVSSVNSEKSGEIESVYVEESYRHMGIGSELMKTALAWMDENNAVTKQVEVSVGNDAAWAFYGRFGFLPRKTLLKQVKKP